MIASTIALCKMALASVIVMVSVPFEVSLLHYESTGPCSIRSSTCFIEENEFGRLRVRCKLSEEVSSNKPA